MSTALLAAPAERRKRRPQLDNSTHECRLFYRRAQQRIRAELAALEQCRQQSLEEARAAFNLGSDARLAGLPRSVNPYRPNSNDGTECVLWRIWRSGWLFTQGHWGDSVRGRWEFPPLPRVCD